MYILGLTGYAHSGSHDAAAALLLDGKLLSACEEERFCRKKHATGMSPINAARFCLDRAGISLSDVDAIAYGWNADAKALSLIPAGSRCIWTDTMFPRSSFPGERMPTVYQVRHHQSHIAGAFYLSGFRDAACICIDGQGESEAITIAYAENGKLQVLKTYDKAFSLGALYEAAAKYSGLGYNVPGKLMGLASYGIARHSLPFKFDSITGNFDSLFVQGENKSRTFKSICEDYITYFEREWFPFARGKPEEWASYIHVAASVQNGLQEILLKICDHAVRLTGSRNLVLCGGVALNCTSNGAVERSGLFEHVFVPPGANDASCSFGAALEVFRQNGYFDHVVPERLRDARLGPDYTDTVIADAFSKLGLKPDYYDETTLCDVVAAAIAKGEIIMWFQGRSEFGPRALGARSILGNPCDRTIHTRVNNIKGRELWRPLSPSVLERAYSEFFSGIPTAPADFMLKAVPARPDIVRKVPAVVHIDGSARPQIVCPEIDGRYYCLIEAFEKISGIPVLMNTSFNRRGEPIVNSPLDALNVFTACPDVGMIAIGNFVYVKNCMKTAKLSTETVSHLPEISRPQILPEQQT